MFIDLAVRGRDPAPQPPVSAYVRVIDEPCCDWPVSISVHRRRSIRSADCSITPDYLGLLKAAVIAAGIVPPGIEGTVRRSRAAGTRCRPRLWFEVVSYVRGIPKGSRLAVVPRSWRR